MADTFTSKESEQVVALSATSSYAILLSISVILLIGRLAIGHLDPPHAVPDNAPIGEFSSARAMAHLRVIAKRPHPQGSAEHRAVRDYIYQQLSSLGLSPQIQNSTVTSNDRSGLIKAATIENIVAMLGGTGNSESIVLVSHYDSVPSSPGASDDGAGVAAMLETLRALRNSPPLKNDVIFLFTDGEEAGLLGARAFVAEHPLAFNVGVVLNFEARGNSGPAIMFETSDGNGWLIDELAQAAPHPVANSLSQEIYRLLPNDTDFSVFKRAGWAGLNFAYISGHTHYHTMLDSLENIDERSLQHQGAYALALSKRLGAMDLSKTATNNNKVYFDLPGWGLVHYSDGWAKPLAALVSALYIGLSILGIRRRMLSGPGLMRGIGIFLMTLMISPIIVAFASLLIGMLYPDYKAFPQGDTYNSGYYLIGYAALVLTVLSMFYGHWQKKISTLDLAMGAIFWWLFPLIATSIFIPGGSYLFVWPLLFSLVALGGRMFIGDTFGAFFKNRLLPLAGALPGVILWSPMIYLISLAFGISLAPVIILLVVLVTGLFIPHLDQALNRTRMSDRWLLPWISLILSVAFISAAIFTARIDREHPRPSSLFYAMNADSGKAIWATMDHRLNAWTNRFLTDHVKLGPLDNFIPSTYPAFLSAQAPIKELAVPEISLVSQSISGTVKTSHFNIKSPRKAPIIFILLDHGAEVISATINGKTANGGGAGQWGLRYLPLPEAGLDLVLVTKASLPIKLKVTDLSYDLPALDELVSNPRPGELISSWFPYSDTTYVSKTYSF